MGDGHYSGLTYFRPLFCTNMMRACSSVCHMGLLRHALHATSLWGRTQLSLHKSTQIDNSCEGYKKGEILKWDAIPSLFVFSIGKQNARSLLTPVSDTVFMLLCKVANILLFISVLSLKSKAILNYWQLNFVMTCMQPLLSDLYRPEMYCNLFCHPNQILDLPLWIKGILLGQ